MKTDSLGLVSSNDRGRTPFVAVAVLTWFTCFSSVVSLNGIFFIARSRYDFSAFQLYILAFLGSIVWLPSPYIAVFIIKWVAERSFMIFLVVMLSVVTPIPFVVDLFLRRTGGDTSSGSWTMYALVVGFGVFIYLFWPVSESFAASGRGRKTAEYLAM